MFSLETKINELVLEKLHVYSWFQKNLTQLNVIERAQRSVYSSIIIILMQEMVLEDSRLYYCHSNGNVVGIEHSISVKMP